jgi:hypothetical protein
MRVRIEEGKGHGEIDEGYVKSGKCAERISGNYFQINLLIRKKGFIFAPRLNGKETRRERFPEGKNRKIRKP